jgi:hypothetical protein
LAVEPAQPAHTNITHIHNQQNQHTCDTKTSYTTTKQQTKNNLKAKNKNLQSSQEQTQQKPTTTQIEQNYSWSRSFTSVLYSNGSLMAFTNRLRQAKGDSIIQIKLIKVAKY